MTKNWARIIIVGLVWGYVFLGWFVNRTLQVNWHFNFFNKNHWAFAFDEVRKGWNIYGWSNVLFWSILILSPILFLIGWRFFLKIDWLKLLRKCVNSIIYFLTGKNSNQLKPQGIQINKKTAKNTRPRALDTGYRPATKETELKIPVSEPSLPQGQGAYSSKSYEPTYGTSMSFGGNQSSGMGYTPPADSPFNRGFSVPSMQQGLSAAPTSSGMSFADSFDDILLDDISLPKRVKLEENIAELFEKANYRILSDVSIGGKTIDYLAISAHRVIIALVDSQNGDWLADEERFNGEDPLWFSESSHRVSPVFQLLELTKKFMQRLSASGFSGSVMPMFIVKTGMIINAEDMLSTWKELSVAVCRTDIGGPDELRTVAQSIMQGETPSDDVVAQVKAAIQG